MKRLRLSFRADLYLRVMLCVTCGLILSTGAAVYLDMRDRQEILLGTLRVKAAYIAALCRPSGLSQDDGAACNTALLLLRKDSHILTCVVVGPGGRTLASYGRDETDVGVPTKPADHDYRIGKDVLELHYETDDLGGGPVRVFLRRDITDSTAHLNYTLLISGLVMLASFGATMLIAFWFQRSLARPIEELISTTNAVSRTRCFSARARRFKDDELGQLTDGFNDMLSQIESRELELQHVRQDLENRVEERTRELHRSEAHLHTAVIEAPFPAMIHAENGEILMLSRVWTEITGYALEDIPDITAWTAKAYGDEVSEVRGMISGLYTMSGRSHEGEIEIRTRSGELRIWDFSSAPLGPLPDGRRAVISMAMDVTRRIEADHRLAESSARLQIANEAAHIGHWDWNIKTNKVYFSPELKRHIGYAPDEFGDTFESWESHLHPEDRAATLEAVQTYLSGASETYRVVFRLRHKNGSYRWILTQADKQLAADGSIERLIGCHVDITELKETEATLQETSTFLNSILENIPNMIFVKEAAELRFIRFNRAGEALLGMSRDKLIGRNDYDFFPHDEADFFIKKDREVLDGGIPIDIPEEPIHTALQGVRFLHTKKVPIGNMAGKPAYMLGISEDITERKQAQQLLESAMEDLKRSNKELEQFAYIASHDLQEPLRMVTSYLQLIEQRYNDKLDDDAREFIGFAVDGAARMRNLILDLLAYSRIGTRGESQLPTPSAEALDIALKNLAVLIAESGATVEQGELPVVLAARSQLSQLFQNLVGNALKFRKDTAPIVRIWAEPDEDPRFWHFRVQDNGIGIESEFFDRIFVIFQRLHRRDQYPGTGIGLALCRKIVERHGGRIWVESTPGKGTTFHFTLRRVEARRPVESHT